MHYLNLSNLTKENVVSSPLLIILAETPEIESKEVATVLKAVTEGYNCSSCFI